jgi:hypothetical protein
MLEPLHRWSLALGLCLMVGAGCSETDDDPQPLPPDTEFQTISPTGVTEYEGQQLSPVCMDGSPYHFFAKRGAVNKLLMYYQGGGACWEQLTCSIPVCDDSVDPEDRIIPTIFAAASPTSPTRPTLPRLAHRHRFLLQLRRTAMPRRIIPRRAPRLSQPRRRDYAREFPDPEKYSSPARAPTAVFHARSRSSDAHLTARRLGNGRSPRSRELYFELGPMRTCRTISPVCARFLRAAAAFPNIPS